MRSALLLPLSAVLAALSAAPSAKDFRWQRAVTLSSADAQREQCVVVDADLYAHAAPGLKDVRLMQDGRELPYATDVSLDDRTGDNAPPPADDRAQYDPVLVLPLREDRDHFAEPAKGRVGRGSLPAHVPVERVRVIPAPSAPENVYVRAAPKDSLNDAESVSAELRSGTQAAAFTVGANLQVDADVQVVVSGGRAEQAVLEMRRRDICFQPLSASPVRMLLGDADVDAPHYDYAAHFQPKATPLLATLGGLESNPDFKAKAGPVPLLSDRQRAAIGAGLCALLLVFTVTPLLRLRR